MTDTSTNTTSGPLFVVISGPSCAGKDSVLACLQERQYPAHFTVTATTRPERDGDSFIRHMSESEFTLLLENDGLLEHAEVYGYHYGVPKAPLREALENGKDVIMRVDVQGAETIKKLVPATVLIFLTLTSVEEIESRIRTRDQDDEASVQRRLKTAVRELDELPKYDYVVVNERDRLDDAVDKIEAILRAEHCRVGRAQVSL